MRGSNRIPTPRLAEKYKECLTSKEKILKEIEVKKEYLSSLQPRLNSIMQVLELCREGSMPLGPRWDHTLRAVLERCNAQADSALEAFCFQSAWTRGRSASCQDSSGVSLFMRQLLQNCRWRSH